MSTLIKNELDKYQPARIALERALGEPVRFRELDDTHSSMRKQGWTIIVGSDVVGRGHSPREALVRAVEVLSQLDDPQSLGEEWLAVLDALPPDDIAYDDDDDAIAPWAR